MQSRLAKSVMTEEIGVKSDIDGPTLIAKVFVGGYLAIFGWLFLNCVIGFWDIIIPWNITWKEYLIHTGPFVVFIVQLGILCLMFWAIFSFREMSGSDAMRWPFYFVGDVAVQVFAYSNMAGEPYPRIGSGWYIDDLRFPAFMSQPSAYLLQIWFIRDTVSIFRSEDDAITTTLLFRPWKGTKVREEWKGWNDNFMGILCLAYIYFSYWFIFMAVSRSWIERLILTGCIWMCRSSFPIPKTFYKDRKFLVLSFVPIYALIRAYYSYDEYLSFGSRSKFILKLAYSLSHIVIFAGWYSLQSSTLAQWTCPYFKFGSEGTEVDNKVNAGIEENEERIELGPKYSFRKESVVNEENNVGKED